MGEIANFGWTISLWPSFWTFSASDTHTDTPPPLPPPHQAIAPIPGRLKTHFLSFSTLRPVSSEKQNAPLYSVTGNFPGRPLTIIKSIEEKIIETLSFLMELGHRQLRSYSCKSLTQFSFPFTMQPTGTGSRVPIVCGKCHRRRWLCFVSENKMHHVVTGRETAE